MNTQNYLQRQAAIYRKNHPDHYVFGIAGVENDYDIITHRIDTDGMVVTENHLFVNGKLKKTTVESRLKKPSLPGALIVQAMRNIAASEEKAGV